MLTNEQKETLLKLARTSIEKYTIESMIPKFESKDPLFSEKRGAFVTIHNNGTLRGCIGMIEGSEPLFETIIEMAIEASHNDPRFLPVEPDEIKDIDIEISVLTPKRRVKSIDEIELGKHGVIVKARVCERGLSAAGGGRNRLDKRTIHAEPVRQQGGAPA